jgi:hypothetical protein
LIEARELELLLLRVGAIVLGLFLTECASGVE